MGVEVALALTVVSAIGQAGVAYQNANEQQDIADAQRATERQAQIQKRRQEYRQRRVAAARIAQSGENTGTAGSSGEASAQGTLGLTTAVNQANATTAQMASSQIGNAQSNITRNTNVGSIFQSVADLGQAFAIPKAAPGSLGEVNTTDHTKLPTPRS